jgi:putative acetyltransferase
MTLEIGLADPLSPEAQTLIDASEVFIRSVFPPDACFTFSAAELATPQTAFYLARLNGTPVGCVALVHFETYSEVKRLFVSNAAKGTGLGRKLMERLEQDAIARNATYICLETGEKLVAAVGLYRSMGYEKCRPYGTYPDCSTSLFMEKRL